MEKERVCRSTVRQEFCAARFQLRTCRQQYIKTIGVEDAVLEY